MNTFSWKVRSLFLFFMLYAFSNTIVFCFFWIKGLTQFICRLFNVINKQQKKIWFYTYGIGKSSFRLREKIHFLKNVSVGVRADISIILRWWRSAFVISEETVDCRCSQFSPRRSELFITAWTILLFIRLFLYVTFSVSARNEISVRNKKKRNINIVY